MFVRVIAFLIFISISFVEVINSLEVFFDIDNTECEVFDGVEGEEDGVEEEIEVEKFTDDSKWATSIAKFLRLENRHTKHHFSQNKYDLISLDVSVPPPIINS